VCVRFIKGKPFFIFVMEKLVYKKTVKVPVHFGTNKKKISKLDKITARMAYAVRLWSRLIGEKDIRYRK